jgi:hypothetical protein
MARHVLSIAIALLAAASVMVLRVGMITSSGPTVIIRTGPTSDR